MGGVIGTLSRIEPRTFLILVAIFLINIFLVNIRLQEIFSFFGQKLAFGIVLRATLSSFLGSLFLGSFFGQSMGRQVSLRNCDVSPETISAITIVERVLTVLIGGSLCLAGSFWIFSANSVLEWTNSSNLVLLTYTILLCVAAVLFVDAQKKKQKPIRPSLSHKKALPAVKIIGVSCAAQILTFVAFIIIAFEVAPNTDFFNLLAATTVIVFASSLPLSVNGWGIRELTSIAVLGEIGIPASSALVVSLSVGICANISFAVLLPYLLKNPTQTLASPVVALTQNNKRMLQSLNYFLITLTSVVILAQVKIKPFSVAFSFNLADPFVLMYVSAVVAIAIKAKKLPKWSVPKLNLYIALFTIVLIYGLLKGYTAIGFTEWAFYGRALGWLVLLAYLLFGFFIVNQLRQVGIVRVTEVMILSLSTIIIMSFFTNTLFLMGIISSPLNYENQFSGLVMNRNAFAFQLLICSALYLVFSPFLNANQLRMHGHRVLKHFLPYEALHGIIVLGIYLAGSRAGIITWLLVSSIFMFAGVLKPKPILRSIGYALAIFLILTFVSFLLLNSEFLFNQELAITSNTALQPYFSAAHSDTLRWDTVVRGIKMWTDNPIFGSGLGVFFAASANFYGKSTVIHSTPIWVLAELGLVGLTLLAAICFNFYKSAFVHDLKKPKNACLLMIMTIFLIFGLVHEIFYQRIFWLAIGLCLAVPWSKRTAIKF